MYCVTNGTDIMAAMSRLRRHDEVRRRLAGLYCPPPPWTAAALWHGAGGAGLAPPTTDTLAAEVTTIRAQKLAPMLMRHLRAHRTEVDVATKEALQHDAFRWATLSQQAVLHGSEAVAALRAHGISCAVSKGPGIARTYPLATDRVFCDLDVIVAPASFARAHRVLSDLGFAEELRSRQPWAYFDRWCREGVNLRSAVGGSVDLHHHVPPWRWGRALEAKALIDRAVDVTVNGVTLPCLSAEDNLLVAALHVVSDRNNPGATLMIWRDIVQLAHAADPARIADRAHATGLNGWLAAVLDALPPSVRPHELAAEIRPGRLRDPARLGALLASPPPRARRAQTLRLPVPGAIAFAAGMAVPRRRFLTEKFPSDDAPYARWWRDLLVDVRERTPT